MKATSVIISFFTASFFFFSCSDNANSPFDCSETAIQLFNETDSLLLVEFESVELGEGWAFVRNLEDATGDGYLRWEGDDHFGNPGEGLMAFSLSINHPGTYRSYGEVP